MPPARAKPRPAPRPLLEWVCGLVGLVLTLTALGLVARDIGRPQSPPELTVRLVQTRPAPQGVVAVIEVRNHGDRAAAEVGVEAAAGGAAAQVTLDYAPGHGRREVELVLPVAPEPGWLRVLGWREP